MLPERRFAGYRAPERFGSTVDGAGLVAELMRCAFWAMRCTGEYRSASAPLPNQLVKLLKDDKVAIPILAARGLILYLVERGATND